MQRLAIIRPDGKFSFPLTGEVQAAGRTPDQVRVDIEGRLKKYIPEPVVTVTVEETGGNRVFVIGQVNKPGVFVMNPQLSVLQALSLAERNDAVREARQHHRHSRCRRGRRPRCRSATVRSPKASPLDRTSSWRVAMSSSYRSSVRIERGGLHVPSPRAQRCRSPWPGVPRPTFSRRSTCASRTTTTSTSIPTGRPDGDIYGFIVDAADPDRHLHPAQRDVGAATPEVPGVSGP